jgi:hypothetical protein
MPSRWEGDDRGRGIADAHQLVAGASELVAAFGEPDWVAEDPEAHLLVHIEDWCASDGRLAVRDAHIDDAGAYVLDLQWRGGAAGVGRVRAASFALVGSFAETATYVRQHRDGTTLRFDVGTGEVGAGTSFAPHGHTVVLNVTQSRASARPTFPLMVSFAASWAVLVLTVVGFTFSLTVGAATGERAGWGFGSAFVAYVLMTAVDLWCFANGDRPFARPGGGFEASGNAAGNGLMTGTHQDAATVTLTIGDLVAHSVTRGIQ